MYAYISGRAAQIGANHVVVDAGGIGYLIYTNSFSAGSFAVGEEARLYTHLIVREDELSLYGFATGEEKAMFEKLISISGIGPKVALSILSTLKVADIAAAAVSANAAAFETVSGVGKKTAQRLVLELKEKVDVSDAVGAAIGGVSNAVEEAVTALINLGYQRAEAVTAVSAVKNLGDTAEDLVLLALKRLA
jgi:Holliday junction DNA helicase RuvA